MLNLYQITKQQPYLATFIFASIYPKQNDLQTTFYLLCQVWILTLMETDLALMTAKLYLIKTYTLAFIVL